MSAELIEYEPGKWQLVIKTPFKDGILTKTLQWDFKPSKDLIQKAFGGWPPREVGEYQPRIGDRLTIKKLGRFYVGKDVSGPVWKWPKVHFSKWSIHVGWRYTAYWISLRNSKRKSGTVDT